MLRCAQSPRSNVLPKYASSPACPERKPKDRFFARLASETFLSSLQSEFFSKLLANTFEIDVVLELRNRPLAHLDG
jgi:hypothetical protein